MPAYRKGLLRLACVSIATVPLVFQTARASGLADPFDTVALTSLSRAGARDGESGRARCDPPQQASLTLSAVVDLALCNNPQTGQAWANARALAADVGSARSRYWPDLNLTASARRQESTGSGGTRSSTQTGAGLSLSYLLYDFGGRDADLESARQRLDALNALHDEAVQSVFLSAVQSAYQWHSYRAALESVRAAEKAAQESLNAANARYQVGTATPLDRLQAQAALSQAVLNRVRAEGDLANARAALLNVMGLSPQTVIELSTPDTPAVAQLPASQLERLMARAQASRPDLLAADAQWRAALASVDVARAQGKPTISLSAGQDWSHNSVTDSSDGVSFGVSVNVPLFSGFADTYRVRAARSNAEASQFNRDRVGQQAALEVAQSFNNLNTYAQSVDAGRDVLRSAEEAFRVASGRYRAGVGTMLDLLNAQNTLSSARLQLIQAEYDWNVARYRLARAIGQVDADLLGSDATPSNGKP